MADVDDELLRAAGVGDLAGVKKALEKAGRTPLAIVSRNSSLVMDLLRDLGITE